MKASSSYTDPALWTGPQIWYLIFMQNLVGFLSIFYLVLSRLPISEMFLDLSYLNIPITHNASSVRREILPVCFPVYLLCHLLCLNL